MKRKVCARCEMPFLTSGRHVKYCLACRKVAYKEAQDEWKRCGQRRKPTSTTDWEGISRICKERGVSYGQAVAMGIITGGTK